MLKLIILLLLVSCNTEAYDDIGTDPDTGEVPDNKSNGKRSCPAVERNSNEYYHLNFVKPQSNEHTQVILEYFQRFNATLKQYHPSNCSPLEDILSFSTDSSNACDIDGLYRGDRQPGCTLYSTIEIIDMYADESITTAGHASRHKLWEQQPDGTKTYRYWTNITLDLKHFLKNHEANMTLPWVIFLHEVGHAFGFDHNESNKHDIMHPTSTEGISYDYDTYFNRVYEIVATVNFE